MLIDNILGRQLYAKMLTTPLSGGWTMVIWSTGPATTNGQGLSVRPVEFIRNKASICNVLQTVKIENHIIV